MAHPNTERIESAYEAFGRSDIQALFELWTDDIVWHLAGDHPLAGDHSGKEQVAAFLAGLAQQTDGTFAAELRHAIADDDHGYSLHRATATKDGQEIEAWEILGYRFADGRFAEIWTYDYDQRVAEKLLS
jgi:ketosteroid isomerase-like protein